MFNRHKYKRGTTLSLLHWQSEWFKKFLRTWYHIFYRPAYWEWKQQQKIARLKKSIRTQVIDNLSRMDEGFGVWDL